VSYLEFTAPELAERATSFLANVSGCFALFELTGGGLLRRPSSSGGLTATTTTWSPSRSIRGKP
jgi:hypothetical protein